MRAKPSYRWWCALSTRALVAVLILMALAGASAAEEQQPSLTITVGGINVALGGQIYFGLYAKAKGFPKDSAIFKGDTVPVTGATAVYSFVDLMPGRYAVAVYHDANSNRVFDRNFIGIPTEGYGFSNGAFGSFGTPPEFEAASFEVKGDKQINLDMKY